LKVPLWRRVLLGRGCRGRPCPLRGLRCAQPLAHLGATHYTGGMRGFVLPLLVSLLSTATQLGCRPSRPRYAAEPEPPPRLPAPEQARARADAWAREDAEADARAREQGRARAEAEAARSAEEARLRAELEANPFTFDGQFLAGRDSCQPSRSFRFKDPKSLASDCARCRCDFAAKRSLEGTTWRAECSGGSQGPLRRKLFVSNRRAEAGGSRRGEVFTWHATFEETARAGGASVTCGYAGWMKDVTSRWQEVETQVEEAGPDYDLPARGEAGPSGPPVER
jgi:hypothetical protein